VPFVEVEAAYPLGIRVPVYADVNGARSVAVRVAAVVMSHSYRMKTETSVSPSRFAKSGYRLCSAQKFFRARHLGMLGLMNGVRAIINQYRIFSAIKYSRICSRQFISLEFLHKGCAPRFSMRIEAWLTETKALGSSAASVLLFLC